MIEKTCKNTLSLEIWIFRNGQQDNDGDSSNVSIVCVSCSTQCIAHKPKTNVSCEILTPLTVAA